MKGRKSCLANSLVKLGKNNFRTQCLVIVKYNPFDIGMYMVQKLLAKTSFNQYQPGLRYKIRINI